MQDSRSHDKTADPLDGEYLGKSSGEPTEGVNDALTSVSRFIADNPKKTLILATAVAAAAVTAAVATAAVTALVLQVGELRQRWRQSED